jgi:septum formation protein
MDAAQIDAYVASGEPMGKAGAYAVQGAAAAFIARISGSYTGIMGLPLFETATLLAQLDLARCTKTS